MNAQAKTVETVDALIAAARDVTIQRIVVRGSLANVPTVRLLPGQSLQGEDERSSVGFAEGIDGVQSSSDHRFHNIRLHASPDKCAIYNDTTVDSLGRIELHGVKTTGRVRILARDKVCGGHVCERP